MKKRSIFLLSIVILLSVVLFTQYPYLSKLYVSYTTGVKDSDDLDIIINTASEYNLSAKEVSAAYNNLSIIFNSEMFSMGIQEKEVEIINLASKGMSEEQIRDYAKDKLFTDGFPKEKLKSLANLGWSPIIIYVMSDQQIEAIFDSISHANQPGGTESMLVYESLADNIFAQYKNNTISYNDVFQRTPADFIFPEIIRWDKYSFYQDEMGYFAVIIPSEDEKYIMTISVDDTTYKNIDGSITDNPPFVRHVSFYVNEK